MKANIPVNLLEELKPDLLIKYLNASGWAQAGTFKTGIEIFRYKEASLSKQNELIVPIDTTFADFSKRLEEVLSKLSDIEQRNPIKILDEIFLPASDIISLRHDDQITKNGTIPIDVGIKLFESGKKALLASASTVLNPKPYYQGRSTSQAERFIHSIRLGQTERGSYIANLVCPLIIEQEDLPPQQLKMFPSEPFTRLVTKTFINSVNQIVTYIDNDMFERILAPQDNDLIISANLCEALADSQTTSANSSLEISSTWAKAAPIEHIPNKVLIKQQHFPVIEYLAKALRPEPEPIQDNFIGKVDTLGGEPNDQELMEGQVILLLLVDKSILKVKVTLNPEDYSKACDAHKLNRYVSIKGTFIKKDRASVIQAHTDFQILKGNLDKSE